jgi:hypothetical protein
MGNSPRVLPSGKAGAVHSDSLDFHEVSVWAIRSALEAAFAAGQAAAR